MTFSYDYGDNVLHPSDFIRSCNDVAIGKALAGEFLTKLNLFL